jgi:hypothetical protein
MRNSQCAPAQRTAVKQRPHQETQALQVAKSGREAVQLTTIAAVCFNGGTLGGARYK